MKDTFKIAVKVVGVLVVINLSLVAVNGILKYGHKKYQIIAWKNDAKKTLGEGEAAVLQNEYGTTIKVVSKKNGKLINHKLNNDGEWVPEK